MFWQTHATSAPENTLTLHRQLKQFYSSWAYHFHRQMYDIYIVHYLIIIIFQACVPFSRENAKYLPILACFGYFVAILRTCWHTFTGQDIVIAHQKWQIRGMGIDSNTHNTTMYWIQIQRQVLLPRRWNRHHVCNPDYHDHNQEVDNENSGGGGQTGRTDVFLSVFNTFIFMMYYIRSQR